jgi:hypothetical protein
MDENVDLNELFNCAEYAPAAMQCLTGGQNHTACCEARGVPDPCRELCATGNGTLVLNYSHMR